MAWGSCTQKYFCSSFVPGRRIAVLYLSVPLSIVLQAKPSAFREQKQPACCSAMDLIRHGGGKRAVLQHRIQGGLCQQPHTEIPPAAFAAGNSLLFVRSACVPAETTT